MKKLLSLVMALAMCLTISVPAFADVDVDFELTTESTTYNIDEETGKSVVKVSFWVRYDEENSTLDTVYADLDYDDEALTFIGYENKIAEPGLIDEWEDTYISLMPGVTGKEKVCDILFEINDPEAAEEYTVGLSYASATVQGSFVDSQDIEYITFAPDDELLPELEFDFKDGEAVYDGKEHSLEAEPAPSTDAESAKFEYDPEEQKFVDAGEYEVKVTATYEGYKATVKKATLTITQKPVTVVDVDLVAQTADIEAGDLIDGDDVEVDFDNVTFKVINETSNGLEVAVNGLALKGADAKNYTIENDPTATVDVEDVRYFVVYAPDNGTVWVAGEEVEDVTETIAIIDGYTVTLEAEADDDYKFTGWTVDGASISTRAEYELTFDDLESVGASVAEIEAKFTKDKKKNPQGGGGSSYYDDWYAAGNGQIAGGATAGASGAVGNVATPVDFKDLVGDYAWAAEPVNTLAAVGILNGRSDDTFDPGANVTRAEFAKMICVAMSIPEAPNTTIPSFADVTEDDWYFGWVEAAAAKGIVNGVTDTTFAPNDNITREQMASMLYRAIVSMGYAEMLPGGIPVSFADYAAIADYAKAAVAELAGAGVINGVTDTTFAPKATATRAQAAAILYQYFSAIGAV